MPGLAAETAELIAALKLDDSGFSGKINKIGGELKRLDRGLSQMGRGAGQLGSGIGRLGERAALAAAGGLTAIVTTAASFEQANVGIEKTASGTQAQIKALEDQLRQMARTVPISFEELAGIAAEGGALGIATDSLDEFTDVVARLGVSTNLSTDQAATALGQLGNVLHLSGDDMRDFADSLVALGNNGASTEDQIVEMAARFGAAGNAAGLSKEEILALSSAVASMGVDVEAGGSALSRVFNSVATNIGTGSKKAKAFAETLGLSAKDFKKAWQRDALGTFEDFLKELSKLDQFDASRVLKDVGITNTRDVNAVRLMAQNVGFVGDQLNIATHAQGALGKESDKFFGTTQAQWKVLANNVRDAAAVMGTDLLPVVNDLISDFVGFLSKPETQRSLKEFSTQLADGIRGFANEMKGTDFGPLLGGLKTAAGAAKLAFDAFRALPAPVQQLAIAALVANKASGGAIGQIAKGLGNLVLGSLKTITAANVTVIGANVTGGGVPGVAGGAPVAAGGSLAKTAAIGVAKWVIGPAAAVALGAEIAKIVNEPVITPAKTFEQKTFDKTITSDGNVKSLQAKLDAINATLDTSKTLGDPGYDALHNAALNLSGLPIIGDALGNLKPTLEQQRDALQKKLDELKREQAHTSSVTAHSASEHNSVIRKSMIDNSNRITRQIVSHAASERADLQKLNTNVPLGLQRVKSSTDSLLSRASEANGYNRRTASASEATSRKNFSPTIRNDIKIPVSVRVSATVLQGEIVKVVNTGHGVNFR